MSEQPAPFEARFRGRCGLCERKYPVGTWIRKLGRGYIHNNCDPTPQQVDKVKEQILAGETFRGYKPSDWRLGGRAREGRL